MFDHLVEGIFQTTPDGHYLMANAALARIYGYSSPEELIQGLTDIGGRLYVEKGRRQEFIRLMQENDTITDFESPIYRKDGSVIWISENCRAIRDSQGRLLYYEGTVEDITQRRQAEEKVRDSEALYHSLVETLPQNILRKDPQGRFTFANQQFCRTLGRPLEEIIGKTDFDFFKTDHAREAFEDEQQIIKTGQPIIGKVEVENHPDGRVTAALTTKMPWRDSSGKIIGTFGISKDITAAKETEAKLAYERDLFHALLENFPDVIYFKDIESRFVRVSRSKLVSSMAILRTRYSVEHPDAQPAEYPAHLQDVDAFRAWLIGKTDFDTFTEERARAALADEQQIIKTGEPIIAKIERTPQADGKVTWCISTKIPWRDKDGRIIGTFGVSKDITALKQAEAELESAHQRLLETSRLAGMAEVATDVLHNVGNVLNSVNVSCSITIDRVKASRIANLSKAAALLMEHRERLGEFFTSDPRAQQIPAYLQALAEHFEHEQSGLLQELEQLLKHIDHIKQIVAMQQSYAKVAGVIETVNPTQLVDDAIQINGAALTRHEVQLRCEFDSVPMIQTEKHRVLQILVNLIRNAKYALDEAKRPDKLLTIKLGRNGGDHVKIEVVDNGVGIPAENLTRIFGHGFTTRRNGHGFGLHSSALAIKELGGSLTAHSDGVGKGATFTLLLPEVPPHAPDHP